MVFPTFRPDGAEGRHLFLEYLARAYTTPDNSAPVHKFCRVRTAFYSAGLEVGKVLILASWSSTAITRTVQETLLDAVKQSGRMLQADAIP